MGKRPRDCRAGRAGVESPDCLDFGDDMSLSDSILYSVIAAVLTFFFFTPISSTVTEAVRPHIERALGERE